jgi:hypothetical protein
MFDCLNNSLPVPLDDFSVPLFTALLIVLSDIDVYSQVSFIVSHLSDDFPVMRVLI